MPCGSQSKMLRVMLTIYDARDEFNGHRRMKLMIEKLYFASSNRFIIHYKEAEEKNIEHTNCHCRSANKLSYKLGAMRTEILRIIQSIQIAIIISRIPQTA